jgi:hypothetical protein
MAILNLVLAIGALNLVTNVAAHGSVMNLVCNGQSFGGITWAHEDLKDQVGWVTPDPLMNEFVDPPRYNTEAINCNTQNTPAPGHAPVPAGSTCEFHWSNWPDHHRGPVLTYLADCKGPCNKVDKTKLEWFKIAEAGMSKDIPSDQPETGHWATDDLRARGNVASAKIPSDIAAGNYVVRHEIIALQEAIRSGNAQHYPRCFNLQVTGGGSNRPAGVVGSSLYKKGEPGVVADILQPQPNGYPIPGPPLYKGGSSGTKSAASTPADEAPVEVANFGAARKDGPVQEKPADEEKPAETSAAKPTEKPTEQSKPAQENKPSEKPAATATAKAEGSECPAGTTEYVTVTVTATPTPKAEAAPAEPESEGEPEPAPESYERRVRRRYHRG